MGVFDSSHSFCHENKNCLKLVTKIMSSVTDSASVTLGIISVIVWTVAEIPQLITNYRGKSTEGLSVAFLLTWIIGDLFNIFGCLLEPATLPTQLYIAVLYTIITISLCSQAIYYGHVYPRLKYSRQHKIDTSTKGESKLAMEKENDNGQSNEFDDFETGIGLSSPIPLPAFTRKNSVGRQLYFQSARYLSKSPTPSSESILVQRMISSSHNLNPIEEPLLGSAVFPRSAPVFKIKTTLCLVPTLTFLAAFNLLKSSYTRVHSKPRQEFVIYVGRKLLQVSGNQMPEHGAPANSSIGNLLGWAMAFIYVGGRLPQICLNIRRGKFEGVNPLMFLFALIGNITYVASILVRSLDWSKIVPNLPWLVESGGCSLLDFFILMQYLYFHYWTSKDPESKQKHQTVA